MPRPFPTKGKVAKLVLVDAHGVLHRAFHALPPLTTSKGEPVGALLGFVRILLKLLREQKPEYLAVCYDAPGPTFRDAIDAAYKAQRPPLDQSLKSQLALAPEAAQALGLKGLAVPGFEADDLLATLAREGRQRDWEVVLATDDKDSLQLVGEGVSVLKADGKVFGPKEVQEKYGVPSSRLVDYFALTGDAIDNVRGARGIGPVTAAKLLGKYGGLEAVLQAAQSRPSDFPARELAGLTSFAERASVALRLIRLDDHVPAGEDLEAFRVGSADRERLVPLFQRLEFTKLLGEILPPSVPPAGRTPRLEPLAAWLDKARGEPSFAFAAREPEGPASFLAGLVLKDGTGAWSGSAEELKALFSGGQVKIAHDVKAGLGLLGRHGLRPRGPYFDTALASYLLNPSRSGYGLADAALEHLGAAPDAPDDGGPEGAVAEARLTLRLAEKLEAELKAQGLESLYRELELPLMEVLARMEADGIGVDRAYLSGLAEAFEARISALKAELDGLAGTEVNLHSPKQLAQLLFETLKLPIQRKIKTGYSTDEETLSALAALHPFPGKLLEYRELTKLKSTYIDNLLAEADPQGRVHTRFNQFGTSTGRLSSVQPNLQNIPVRTDLGMRIRRAFAPRPGWVFLSADYSQIDLRVLAHVTQDEALVSAFRGGEDIHAQTACEIFNVLPGLVDKEMRRRAKAVNFGIVYGQGPHGLSRQLGLSFGEAQGMIRRYFERYKGVRAWIDAHLDQARREGKVRTLLGRLRYLPELAAAGAAQRGFAERAAVNTPIQGGSSDIIKKAMLTISRGLEAARPRAFRARMLLQVHDELLFEAPSEELEALAGWVRSEMERAVELAVPLLVDLKSGPNWADLRPYVPQKAGGRDR